MPEPDLTSLVYMIAKKKASVTDTSAIHERLLSEADGTRTRNHRIASPVL